MADQEVFNRIHWDPADIVLEVPRGLKPTGSESKSLKRHGSLGEPGYHKLHPGNAGKGLRQLPMGGMIGSPDFTEAEHRDSLAGYLDDSQDVNEWLRNRALPGGGTQDDVTHNIDSLDDLITIQDPLEKPRTVYRGSAPMDLEIGDEFHDQGFSSASDQESLASAFAMRYLFQGKGKGSVMTINMPKGTQVLPVGEVAPDLDNEEEWIFPPGTSFRVTGVTDDGYELDVVL